jgi:hypothetical protein
MKKRTTWIAGAVFGFFFAAICIFAPVDAGASGISPGRGGSSSSGSGAVEDINTAGIRTAWVVPLDAAAVNFASFGIPAPTTANSASGTLLADTTTDATRMMIKLSISAASNYVSHGVITGTERGWKPKLYSRVYISSIAAPGGGTREFKMGVRASLPASNSNSDCATGAGGAAGAWVCYTDWTGAAGGGANWILTTHDGSANVSTASSIAVTAGMHTLLLDFSDTSKVTLTVDGVLAVTSTTSLPPLTTSLGPFLHAGTFAGLGAWSVSSTGFLLVQDW